MSAPMNGEAVLRAIKGVVAGELGSVRRVVTSGGQPLVIHAPEVIEVENPLEERLFLSAGHWFDLQVTPLRDHPATPTNSNSNRAIELLEVVINGLSSGGQGDRFSIATQGAVLDVCSKIRQALGWHGNLTVDDRGQQTAIVSGCLVGPGGATGGPVAVIGERDCHLIPWRVSGAAILELEQATS